MSNIDFSFMDLYESDSSCSKSEKCYEIKDESFMDLYEKQGYTSEYSDNEQMEKDNSCNKSFEDYSEIIFDEYDDKKEPLLNTPNPTQNNTFLEYCQYQPLSEENGSSNLFAGDEDELNIYIPKSQQDNTVNEVKCGICKKYTKKLDCFVMKNDHNTYICLNCAIGKKNVELEDWEEHHSKHDYPRLKRCIRCMKYKNKCRFKNKVKYCSYCSLKKKLSYLKKK